VYWGTFADGGLRKCETINSITRCVYLGWPDNFYAYARGNTRRTFWHGSLIEDKRDGAGTLYRRNRSYDPQTGRFTQEDPIGLAGGLNLYGFAGGDPVNFSDPFGLSAQANCPICIVGAAWALYEVGSAAYDVYQAYNTVNDPDASDGMKAAMVGAALYSVAGPGGGGSLVIGKLDDLKRGLQAGERTLLPQMTKNLGSPQANWKRNAGLLRQEMRSGRPIRDAHVDPRTGALLNDRKANGSGSFLSMERNLLREQGWGYNQQTRMWHAPQR
jgi:RHS repeat-associated protein